MAAQATDTHSCERQQKDQAILSQETLEVDPQGR
jgi:hypothetical protein